MRRRWHEDGHCQQTGLAPPWLAPLVSADWDCGPRAVDAPRHDASMGRLPRPASHWCPGHTAGEGGITWNFSRATCIFIGVLGVFGVFQQILIGEEEQKPDTPPIFHGVFWCVWGGMRAHGNGTMHLVGTSSRALLQG